MNIQHITSYKNKPWIEEGFELTEKQANLKVSTEAQQEVLGFGACFNELGWQALQKTSIEERDNFLDQLFSPNYCNFNYGRVPIGANDFSLKWYSCHEEEDYDLNSFNIERDKTYTIPFVSEAVKRQKDFYLFASPWSPPIWMKTHEAYNYGTLKMDDETLNAYSNYFVKFVKAYEEIGLNIQEVHVQNEPMSDQKFPSCVWTGEEMKIFIKDYLGPKMKEEIPETELWFGTLNGPFLDYQIPELSSPYSQFYGQFAQTVLEDYETRKYINGVGVQWGGKHMLEQIEASYPELDFMQTESECGDGENSWTHMSYIFNQMWYYFRHGVKRYTYWNIALFEEGSSTWGWKQNSLCTVNNESGQLKLQPEFYLMKHVSQFLGKGGRVLKTEGPYSGNTMAFINKDGSVVLVILNDMNEDKDIIMEVKDQNIIIKAKAQSIHTLVIK